MGAIKSPQPISQIIWRFQMTIDSQARYSKTHEWLRPEGDLFAYGISDHAQAELSDVVYIELPEVGTQYSAGDSIGVVESVKAASDLVLPVSGTIVEVNQALAESPEAINSDPYHSGWIVKIKLADAGEWDALMTPEAYGALIGE
jgi:glycine cleavage system H protein